jgi:RNA-directed DNA polymerase
LERAKSGTYHAPPVRRVRIPRGTGAKTRPIGIPTFEDKVLQRAVAMLLGAVYEQDFRSCSYGFRPRRSAHQALQVLWEAAMRMQGGGSWSWTSRTSLDRSITNACGGSFVDGCETA